MRTSFLYAHFSFKEIDIKAGGGKPMTMGELNRLFLTRQVGQYRYSS
jgi:hypothetical protein